ncbi:hypothetical protein [Lysinibacillus sp. JNUCC-52]|uniref:hypothetical protein n=1 Tax=Lysinibacillus sp. JNUCC-52 TaxID=2792480 RepID=UPI001936D8A3|nr:hypothetical protein JNUCC52_11045 [Lysinibacillus sp. JNUCC-52]
MHNATLQLPIFFMILYGRELIIAEKLRTQVKRKQLVACLRKMFVSSELASNINEKIY